MCTSKSLKRCAVAFQKGRLSGGMLVPTLGSEDAGEIGTTYLCYYVVRRVCAVNPGCASPCDVEEFLHAEITLRTTNIDGNTKIYL